MRFVSFGIGIAVFLAASVASAAGGVGGKGDTGGKGGNGPVNETNAGTGAGATAGPLDTSQIQLGGGASTPEKAGGVAPATTKAWEVSGTFETHRLIRQEDLGGAGAVKTFNVLFAVGRYDITDYDRVSVSGGGYQFFLADSGESGFRAVDISLGYTRRIPLPAEFLLRLSAATTIPISYDSQLASNITSPSISAAVSRKFGDLALEARITGGAFIDRYTTAGPIGSSADSSNADNATGQTNPKWRLGGTITAEYSMPFHRPLSAGVGLIDSYIWYYDVGQCPIAMPQCQVVQDPQYQSQPMQQSYGGEVFVRYQMPNVGGMKSDITVALANGDPSLGYPSVMNGTGILHPYFFYRDTAEFYAALSATY